uniref:non-specific serine/threonine protein kinase n=1 Tax=Amphilophus citrinellus TaxID=61819 RepID=A0A3Q0R603_AMPCI
LLASEKHYIRTSPFPIYNSKTCICVCVAHFEAKYTEDYLLGEGGYGSVLAGMRKADYLPVSITYTFLYVLHIATIPLGTRAAVSILDWYDLEQEVLLVMERPVPCVNLLTYIQEKGLKVFVMLSGLLRRARPVN